VHEAQSTALHNHDSSISTLDVSLSNGKVTLLGLFCCPVQFFCFTLPALPSSSGVLTLERTCTPSCFLHLPCINAKQLCERIMATCRQRHPKVLCLFAIITKAVQVIIEYCQCQKGQRFLQHGFCHGSGITSSAMLWK
jgi:hypothetical protein